MISSKMMLDLAVKAARNALDNAGITASELDFIIVANVINEYVTPALSCILQGAIGATCPCVDLNGACVGFVYGIDMAEAYYKAGKVKKVLIVCAEQPSRMLAAPIIPTLIFSIPVSYKLFSMSLPSFL